MSTPTRLPTSIPHKIAISSASLGKHPTANLLPQKILALAARSFHGIEVVRSDIVAHAAANGHQSIFTSASQIGALAREQNIEIISLCPLKNFEGLLDVPLEHRLRAVKEDWIDLAVALGTKIVQMPSQFLGEDRTTGDFQVIVEELRALADLAAEVSIKIAYEAVAFGRYVKTWQDGLKVVEAVGRDNFGLCLDSYHIHALLYGDARTKSGLRGEEDAVWADLNRSMDEFVLTCPKEKVFLLQISDASRFDPPLTDDSPLYHGLEVPEMTLAWSRVARPFALEEPGYFPVVHVCDVWFKKWGWEGWVSQESFLAEAEKDDVQVVDNLADRAKHSTVKLYKHLGYELGV